MEPPFQGEQKNVFDSDRTLKAEKQAACLKCKSNLPTLTVRLSTYVVVIRRR